jgi:GTP-binding protein HflX
MRAQTHEGALQVELARLNYASTRLVKSWTHLERQKGGIGVRGGPGETQLELDRRMVRDRISLIESRLDKVSKQRTLGRNSRKKSNIPTVAVVGYTNAGKSTLFNQLTGADVLVKDQLFATLDPTLRKVYIPRLGDVVFSDTVGFIRNLPHSLVEAFCSTLEEAVEADLLLHVVDVSDENYIDYMEQVNIVLSQIGADNKPIINVFNKIDLVEGLSAASKKVSVNSSNDIYLSVKENDGISLLKEEVANFFHGVWVEGELHLLVSQGKIRAELYELEVVTSEEILEDGSFLLEVTMSQTDLDRICMDNTLDIDVVFSQQ